MWIVRLLQKTVGYGRAYLFGFSWDGVATRSQYTRLYFVNLAFAGLALFGLFAVVGFFRGEPDPNAVVCKPIETIHFLAFFVLAEIASFLFLLLAFAGSYVTARPFSWKAAYHELTTVGHRLEWRHYRLLWLWFPVVILLLAMLAAGNFRDVVADCLDLKRTGEGQTFAYKFGLLKTLVVPYFVAIFFLVAFGYWWVMRWQITWRAVFILALSFMAYVVVLAIVGPPDLLGLVSLAREAPELFQRAYTAIKP